MEHQCNRRGGAAFDRDIGAGNSNPSFGKGRIGLEDRRKQRGEGHFLALGLGLFAVGPDEFVRAPQRGNPAQQVARRFTERFICARCQADQTGNNREDVLDAMAELLTQDFVLEGGALLLVDIRTSADPALDLTLLVEDRQRTTDHPAIIAAVMPQAIFNLVRFAGSEAVVPFLPCVGLVILMEHPGPSFAVG